MHLITALSSLQKRVSITSLKKGKGPATNQAASPVLFYLLSRIRTLIWS
jgi:hypothetical protein